MQIVANLLLAIGAIGAGIYCLVLSRRLRQFTQLENGMGGAIAVLSLQVDELKQALVSAQAEAAQAEQRLGQLVRQADEAALRLDTVGNDVAPDRRHLRVLRKRHAGADFFDGDARG